MPARSPGSAWLRRALPGRRSRCAAGGGPSASDASEAYPDTLTDTPVAERRPSSLP